MKGEGGPVSFGVWWCRRRRRRCAVCFCFGGGKGASQLPGCEGGRGASQLWSLVVSSSVFVLVGGRGPVSFGVWWCRRRRRRCRRRRRRCAVCFCFGGGKGASQLPGCEGGRGASQLWSLVVSPSVFVLVGGRGPVSFGVWWCRRRRRRRRLFLFWWGEGASQLPGCEGGRGASQLWSLVVSSSPSSSPSVFVLVGGRGRVSFRAVKGEGGPVSFGVWWCRRRRRRRCAVCFCFGGGKGASQLPGCEGGRGASQLWSLVVSSSVFVLVGGRGPVSFGVWWCRRRRRRRCAVCFCFGGGTGASQLPGCEGGRGASQLWSLVVSSSSSLCCLFLFWWGEGGQSALEFGGVVVAVVVAVLSVFVLGRAGGQSASGL